MLAAQLPGIGVEVWLALKAPQLVADQGLVLAEQTHPKGSPPQRLRALPPVRPFDRRERVAAERRHRQDQNLLLLAWPDPCRPTTR